jgi:hypothetical protein
MTAERPPERPRSDFDGCWKEALVAYFEASLAFFFPWVHALIDWTEDVESLEQELRQLAPQGEGGRRLADKLVRVQKKSGDVAYLHVEVQSQPEQGFEHRCTTYNDRAQDRFGQPVATLLVLGDDDPGWRPSVWEYAEFGFRKRLEFPIAKLLDYRGREAELEAEANPFGLLVAGHLLALETRQDLPRRAEGKLRLILRLHERGMEGEDVRRWYRLLDGLLDLPEEMESQVWQQVARFEEERRVTFVTYAERHGMKIGMEKGLQQGRQEGLLRAIELALGPKFGSEGLELLPAVRAVADLNRLEGIFQVVVTPASSLDDVRRLLAPGDGAAAAPP